MAVLVFPNIAPPSYPFIEDWEDMGMSSKCEDGSVVSRARFTRSRGTWTIRWNVLSDEDYQTLMNFKKNVVRGSCVAFNWTHPVTAQIYTVRASSWGKFERQSYGWSGELTLQEV